MAWSTQQLLFRPHPDTLAALRAIPSLDGHLYHIPHLRDFDRTEEEPFAFMFATDGGPGKEVSRTVTRVHPFPPGGLLVVGEFADPEDDRKARPSKINWNCFDFTPLDAPVPIECPPPESCFSGAPESWLKHNPPQSLRRAAAFLAYRTRSVAAYLGIEKWGGDLEHAIAWVWDGRDSRCTFLRAALGAERERDIGAGGDGAPGAVEVTTARSRFIATGDVLTLALLHFDVLLRAGYFIPHTGPFSWDRYLVG